MYWQTPPNGQESAETPAAPPPFFVEPLQPSAQPVPASSPRRSPAAPVAVAGGALIALALAIAKPIGRALKACVWPPRRIILTGQCLVLLTDTAFITGLAYSPLWQRIADRWEISHMDTDQDQNARAIVNAGKACGASERDCLIAIMTALQESSMKNMSHGDKDSLGLFQQRPSQDWGTKEEIMDPTTSATSFFIGHGTNKGLLAITNRERMSLAACCQAVQRSAFPSAYAKRENAARAILARLSQPDATVPGGKRVAVIVGHSQAAPGATSPGGLTEFAFNSPLASDLAGQLKAKGVDAQVFIRQGNGIADVVARVNAFHPSLSVELHANSTNGSGSGSMVLYWYESEASQRFAARMLPHITRALGLRSLGLKPIHRGERGCPNLRGMEEPAVLLEPFFIDSSDLERAKARQSALVAAYAAGICETLNQ